MNPSLVGRVVLRRAEVLKLLGVVALFAQLKKVDVEVREDGLLDTVGAAIAVQVREEEPQYGIQGRLRIATSIVILWRCECKLPTARKVEQIDEKCKVKLSQLE